MAGSHTDADWQQIGAQDAYFGVLTDEAYKQGSLRPEVLDRFFQTGDEHVARVLATVASRLRPGFRPRRVADFGCGVGRLLPALAAHADEVVGIDVSPGMLEEAARNCARLGVSHVTFARSDDALTQVEGPFDLIHSVIVFQHIPVARGERLLRGLVARLSDGGIGALHFTTYREGPLLRRLVTWARAHVPLANGLVNLLVLRERFGAPMMQMNEYDLGRLVRILAAAGCSDLYLSPTAETFGPTTAHGVMIYFTKRVAGTNLPAAAEAKPASGPPDASR